MTNPNSGPITSGEEETVTVDEVIVHGQKMKRETHSYNDPNPHIGDTVVFSIWNGQGYVPYQPLDGAFLGMEIDQVVTNTTPVGLPKVMVGNTRDENQRAKAMDYAVAIQRNLLVALTNLSNNGANSNIFLPRNNTITNTQVLNDQAVMT